MNISEIHCGSGNPAGCETHALWMRGGGLELHQPVITSREYFKTLSIMKTIAQLETGNKNSRENLKHNFGSASSLYSTTLKYSWRGKK